MPVATPQSPPKRMTRARAKAVEETKRVPSRPARPAVSTTTTSKAIAARNAKRKVPPDEDEDGDESSPPAQPRPAAGRPKPQPQSQPSKQGRPGTQSSKNIKGSSSATSRLATASSAAKSMRSRPKTPTGEAQESIQDAKVAPAPTRSTRARTASVTDNVARQKPTAPTRKKVTFQDDDSEKENVSAKPATQSAKSAQPSGIKAKPVRNAAPAKSTVAKGKTKAQETSKFEPLSPRKNVQVSQPGNEERGRKQTPVKELARPVGELNKSPIRVTTPAAQRTPAKMPTIQSLEAAEPTDQQEAELDVSMDELQGSTAIFTSPTKGSMQNLIISSPPKRPALSPYKGGLSGSPRKFDNGCLRQLPDESNQTLTEPTLSKPPKKFPMSEPRKKTVLDLSDGSEVGTSLFQSPARRPLSPSKIFASTGNVPATTSTARVMTPSLLQQSPRRGLFSPAKNITSALRALKSPEASAKVHNMTPEEQSKMFEDELAATDFFYSPTKCVQSTTKRNPTGGMIETPVDPEKASKPVIMSPPSSPSPERDCLKPQSVLSKFNPTLCPSPSAEENVSILEPVAFTDEGSTQRDLSIVDCIVDESEDELQSTVLETYQPSPVKVAGPHLQNDELSTPKPTGKISDSTIKDSVSMTVLAQRFGGWEGATPDVDVLQKRKTERSMFTPLHPIVNGFDGAQSATPSGTEADETELDEGISILEDEDELMVDSPSPAVPKQEDFRQSQISNASQDYGDENAVPIDPTLLAHPEALTATCTPARVFDTRPKITHTVCKVPLKPAAEDTDSPTVKPARRTLSLSGELSTRSALELEGLRQINPPARKFSGKKDDSASTYPRVSKFSEMLTDDDQFQEEAQPASCLTPSAKTDTLSVAGATPMRTPRPGLNTRLLSGAVVFVDVHTSEGADASGIFIELLQHMGAKCVKQWNWNSRNSLGGSENAAGDLAAFGSTRVGITHVVFKDGGKRTMEKVREAKGLVLCVGVGWVLDCERENKWLDEADYAIDSSTIPRGGHRRRKSMEPKALSQTTFAPLAAPPQMSPTKEFLNLSSPVNRRATTIGLPISLDQDEAPQETESPEQATPRPIHSSGDQNLMDTPISIRGYDEYTLNSPVTPYFLHPEQLTQQTCPPKQSHQVLFPLSGRIEDEPDEKLRQRLLLARRKSLQWAPKIASPLSRAHSYQ